MKGVLRFLFDAAALAGVGKMAYDAYGYLWVPVAVLVFIAYGFWVWIDGIAQGRK